DCWIGFYSIRIGNCSNFPVVDVFSTASLAPRNAMRNEMVASEKQAQSRLTRSRPRQESDPIAFSRPYFGSAEAEAAAAAVRSGWIVGGAKLAEFERRFAAICGARHAVGVSSCTTGAALVLHAWGIGAGDEVIVPSLTFIASINVIRHVGATPVF